MDSSPRPNRPALKPIQDVTPPGDALGNPVNLGSDGLGHTDPFSRSSAPRMSRNPIAGTAIAESADEHAARHNDDDLDVVLKDVNKDVKNSQQPVSYPRVAPPDKQPIPSVPQKIKTKAGFLHKHKLLVPTLIAAAAAAVLAVAAFFAFSYSATKTAQSSKTNPSTPALTPVQTAAKDLDSMAQNLQTKIGSLNDGQEFSADGLSDKSLGL